MDRASSTGRFLGCRITLVRHGQARSTDGSYGPDTPLSELGRRQAAAVGAALATGSRLSAAYTSPLPRARETTSIVGDRLGVPVTEDDRLAEFELGTGALTSVEDRPDLLIWRSDHTGVEGGETLGEFCRRVTACMEEIVERHLDQKVMVVAHAGTIDAVLRWAVGLPSGSPWQHEFDLANGSLTEVICWPLGRVEGGARPCFAICSVGAAGHLGDLVSDL